jgi:hypothetical protein
VAAPNLLSPISIIGKTVGASLGNTNATDVLVNAAASEKVLKVNSVYAANVDGVNSVNITFSFYDASASASYKIIQAAVVSAGNVLVVVEKTAPIYLEEGDKLIAQASSASDLELVISYEEIT